MLQSTPALHLLIEVSLIVFVITLVASNSVGSFFVPAPPFGAGSDLVSAFGHGERLPDALRTEGYSSGVTSRLATNDDSAWDSHIVQT